MDVFLGCFEKGLVSRKDEFYIYFFIPKKDGLTFW
jgi:hypothetical protein